MLLSYYFSSPTSSQIFPASLLTQLDILTLPSLLSLSKQKEKHIHKTKIKTNEKKKARPKKIFFTKRKQNEKKKVHKQNIEFILCWPTIPWHEAYPGEWFIYQVALH